MAYNNSRLKGILTTQTTDFIFPTAIVPSKIFSTQLSQIKDDKLMTNRIDELVDSLLCGNLKKDSIIDINSKEKFYKREGFSVPEATHKLDCSNEIYEYWSKDISIEDRLVYRILISNGIVELINCMGHFDYKTIEKLESRKTFSGEVLAEKELWLKEHSHLSKQAIEMLMPLRFKYPDISKPSDKFNEALEKANKNIVNTVSKQPIRKLGSLSIEELVREGIRGTLINRAL